jgi:L-malate glycosyltransferase
MRVLIANHTSTVSGAEHALLDLLAALPSGIEAVVAAPPGDLAERLAAAGHAHLPLTGTAGSLKLGLRHTPVGVAQLMRAGWELRRLARRTGAQVVHANSVRSGLSAVLARRAGGPPVLVQVHDCIPGGAAAGAVRRVVIRADALVANSAYTARCLGGAGARARVTYNPVDLGRFDPSAVDGDAARRALGVPLDAPLLAIVGQITPWKGQATAIAALARLRASQPGARLVVAGSTKFVDAATRYDNRAYLEGLHSQVAEAGLGDAVLFTGEHADVPAVVAAADLVLVPSREEPFGRIVVEALAMGTPVLATRVGGPAEVIEDGREGLLLDPRDPDTWARAAASLLADPARRARMGAAGRETARRFDRGAYARAMVEVYEETAALSR